MDEDFKTFLLRASNEGQSQFQPVNPRRILIENRAGRIQRKQRRKLTLLKQFYPKLIPLSALAFTFQKLDVPAAACQIQTASFLEITGVIQGFDCLADGFNGFYACPISSN